MSVVEATLYLLALPLYFSKLRKSQLFVPAILISTFYGTILHGFDLASVLYSIKLIAMIASGVALGDILNTKFKDNRDQCLIYFIKVFFIILLLGIAIFIFFPRAHLFFQFLENYGIRFSGDPHQRRFISTFFDPNYYGAIACIPLILIWNLKEKKMKHQILFFLFLASVFLSFSRSGIATCILMFAFSFLRQKKIQWVPLLFIPLLLIYSNECLYLLNRLLHIGDDPSALARLLTFQQGLKIFSQYPLFGTGYNYLSLLLQKETGILSLDSSPLSTLVNFGLIPCLAFFFCGFVWTLRAFRKDRSPLFSWLYLYLLLSIFFTSQFNNLLYYQYWLVPMIALFTYLQRRGDEDSASA
ncbi:MAG: O-antigen ligase family protein [Verrucomicrobia bacterium]|nr:O-antigen ligase family protein [Verrucomicrobiota bacterium]